MGSRLFLTAIHGERYIPFILTYLQSLVENLNVLPRVKVLWNDLSGHEVYILKNSFTWCEFIHEDFDNPGIKKKDVPLKLRLWLRGLETSIENTVCLMDCDTVVVRDFDDLIADGDFDILYTFKKEKFPLNTGVMVVRNSSPVRSFFRSWLHEVERILAEPKKLAAAMKENGAADQHGLVRLLGEENIGRSAVILETEAGELRLKGIECSKLNQTRSCPIRPETRIIHYKGGWQPVLLENEDFPDLRPREDSLEMYRFWQALYESSCSLSMRKLVFNACERHADKFSSLDLDFQPRGILHSEMLLVCSVCEELGIEVIIESGRYRGQSTLALAKYFSGSPVFIESIELARDENAEYCESRLSGFPDTVQLNYGDCRFLLPHLVKKHRGRNTAILLDGPKGELAMEVFSNVLRQKYGSSIVAGFFHDTKKQAPFRPLFEESFRRVFFSDDPEYVDRFRSVDEKCMLPPLSGCRQWRPYSMDGQATASYGPTLCAVLPLYPERIASGGRYFELKKTLWKLRSVAGKVKRKIIR